MRLDIERLGRSYERARRGRESAVAPERRARPSLFQYDYLTLSRLSADVRALIGELPAGGAGARALDLGCGRSPYSAQLAGRGYRVETLDLTLDDGADFAGTAERTELPDETYDAVLCTQVLEHCEDPWQALLEVRRILKADGWLIASAPHVWFYHPHPADHWRFTQEGILRLCRHAGLEPVMLLAQGGSVLTVFQVFGFLLYGVLGRYGAPLYALANIIGSGADRLFPNELFCHNFACLARRP